MWNKPTKRISKQLILCSKCTQSNRNQSNEQTNGKISLPETQMLAYRDIFSCAIVDTKAFLITLRHNWEMKEQKHSQCYLKLAVLKRWSLNSLIQLFRNGFQNSKSFDYKNSVNCTRNIYKAIVFVIQEHYWPAERFHFQVIDRSIAAV